MGNPPPEAVREIVVSSAEREVAIGAVSAEDTWSFSAAGEWKTGFVWCGADGYRNFLSDALNFVPRVPGQARLKLMGRFVDEPDWAAFPIGVGCTKPLPGRANSSSSPTTSRRVTPTIAAP